MPIIIKNLGQLQKELNSRIIKAMELTKEEIFDVVFQKVVQYYNEPVFSLPDETEPDVYRRTGRLMESLTASHVVATSNGFQFTVGWDDDYLTFRYPGNPTWEGNVPATGFDVLSWMDDKLHGYTVSGNHRFWSEALSELGGKPGILSIFESNLTKCGVPLKSN